MSRPNPYLEIDRAMVGDIYTSQEVWENLLVLCDDYGSRTPGSPEERQAAEFLRDKLAAYGFANARLEPYRYHAWKRGDATFTLTQPLEREIPCIALPYCPPAEVRAPLIVLEDGGPETFQRRAQEIQGAIVAVSSRPPAGTTRVVHRTEMYHRAALGGAVAFVFIGMYEGRGPETGSIGHDREGLIPGISIAYEAGEYLRRLQARKGPLQAHIHTQGRTYPATSWNVIAELPGSTEAVVLLGCHYDAHDIAQGALDPTSGTVSALEAARVLAAHAPHPLTATLRVIFWGTEEIGLTGAHRDVAHHPELLDRIRFVLNCDMAGSSGEKGLIVNQWPDLEPFLRELSAQLDDMPFGQSVHGFSDHYPYFLKGVPTGYIGNPRGRFTGRGWGHTAYDTVDKVQLEDLRRASSLIARIVLRIAAASDWPLQRRSESDVQVLIAAEPNLAEMARVEAEYDALYRRRRSTSSTEAAE